MDIYNLDLDIDLLEFPDRFGVTRSTSGCSFKGKVEFDSRIEILSKLLENYKKETIGQIYQENREFRHQCDRCLKLNGINPRWLTEAHITQLLFVHKNQIGALVLLNRANNPGDSTEEDPTPSDGKLYHQFLASMYNFSQNPEQAFRLAENHSFKEVAGMIKEVGRRQEAYKDKPKTKRSPEPKRTMSDRSKLDLMQLREKTKSQS